MSAATTARKLAQYAVEVHITEQIPALDETLALYESVGWSAYTRDPATLEAAIKGSHRVFVARAPGGKLAGLARAISDGHTIAYLQDILVDPEHHRQGIGGALLDRVLQEYEHVRQLVLLTDDEPSQRALYESRGLTELRDAKLPLRSFVRFA